MSYSKLEKDFKFEFDKFQKENAEKFAELNRIINEITDSADKHGVPFRANVSPLGNNYVPRSYKHKFGNLEHSFVEQITGVYSNYDSPLDYSGWTHSAVC